MSPERQVPLATPSPGQSIGHYSVLDRLGRGGMGEVLLALDNRLDRKVALKILPVELVADEERLARFAREARVLAALNHPNIVTIFSVEETEGYHFLVMELVEGRSLRQLIPPEGLELSLFLALAVPLADALAAAHERGITHRDLKPENIMVTPEGWVKVLDFGLARIMHEEMSEATSGGSQALTRDGLIVGTLPYMSPEQAQGMAVDQRSDIFSLGVVFYEMLTGCRPFRGETLFDLLSAILNRRPSSVSAVRPHVPQTLAELVHRCLEKAPERRIQSARELRERLHALQRELELGRAGSGSQTVGSRVWQALGDLAAGRWLSSRAGLTLLLALVVVTDLVETALETMVKARSGLGLALGLDLARAASWLEGGLSFESHDATNLVAVYGSSAAYFFLLPVLLLASGAALARRRGLGPYRVFALAITVAYGISLPFYLLFPVPERWAFPDSDAVLLSDLWSSRLIEAFRPLSGLDNCFPSFHVALTVIVVLVAYLYRLRLRNAMAAFGATVILSTFILGIHWLGDMVAGLGTGALGVAVALWLERARAPAKAEEVSTLDDVETL